MARRRTYWKGFAAGAGAGAVGVVASLLLARIARNRGGIIRLDKSLQIGRPVEEVFAAWSDLNQLARSSSLIRSISVRDQRSHWVAEVNGRTVEWEADIEQFVPNQAIGWKSVSGPKHTGRVTFSSLGNDTLVNVTMNYAPRLALLRATPAREQVQQYLEQVLRDFKATLEQKGGSGTTGTHYHTATDARATGTLGGSASQSSTQHTRFGGPQTPVDYTRPPEAKS